MNSNILYTAIREMTPQQRNEAWMTLEQKYRPYLTFGDLPFYGRGAGWQRQMHIYLNPLLLYRLLLGANGGAAVLGVISEGSPGCLETVSCIGQPGWNRYLFVDVVKAAGLKSPFEDGCVKEAAEVSKEWCLAHQLKSNRMDSFTVTPYGRAF